MTTLLAPAALAGAVRRGAGRRSSASSAAPASCSPSSGALGLLHRRLTDDDLKPYTTAGDLFNLAAFIGALGLLGAGLLLQPAGAPGVRAMVAGCSRGTPRSRCPACWRRGCPAACLAAYIPFTHMSHFVGKYFTYHAVRWDDAVNRRGGAIERRLAGYLTYRPTWSAPHVTADGDAHVGGRGDHEPAEKAKR